MRFLDKSNGITTNWAFDRDKNRNILEMVQDVEPILEFNQRAAGMLDKKQEWWFVGSIPLVICQQWATESGTTVFSKEWQEYARKQMNSSEYSKLNPNRIKM